MESSKSDAEPAVPEGCVSAKDLEIEELRLRYAELLADPGVFPTRTNWEFITANRMEGLGGLLYDKYLISLAVDDVDRADLHNIAVEEFPRYLAAVDHDYAVSIIYPTLIDNIDAAMPLIRRCRLFDAVELCRLVESGHADIAADLVDVYRPYYNVADLSPMRRLAMLFDHLPVLGEIRSQRGIFGTSDKYICPRGHVNNPESRYCTHSGCGLDAHGLTAGQNEAIETYKRRVEALTNLLKHRQSE